MVDVEGTVVLRRRENGNGGEKGTQRGRGAGLVGAYMRGVCFLVLADTHADSVRGCRRMVGRDRRRGSEVHSVLDGDGAFDLKAGYEGERGVVSDA